MTLVEVVTVSMITAVLLLGLSWLIRQGSVGVRRTEHALTRQREALAIQDMLQKDIGSAVHGSFMNMLPDGGFEPPFSLASGPSPSQWYSIPVEFSTTPSLNASARVTSGDVRFESASLALSSFGVSHEVHSPVIAIVPGEKYAVSSWVKNYRVLSPERQAKIEVCDAVTPTTIYFSSSSASTEWSQIFGTFTATTDQVRVRLQAVADTESTKRNQTMLFDNVMLTPMNVFLTPGSGAFFEFERIGKPVDPTASYVSKVRVRYSIKLEGGTSLLFRQRWDSGSWTDTGPHLQNIEFLRVAWTAISAAKEGDTSRPVSISYSMAPMVSGGKKISVQFDLNAGVP